MSTTLPCRRLALVPLVLAMAGSAGAQPVGTAFTHQGRLTDGGTPANGPYDFRCILYDAAAGSSQVGPIVTLEDVPVVAGLFTIALDFGDSAFRGRARWLEVAVRAGASTGAYAVVGPRQELRPTPQAVFSTSADSAASVAWAGVSSKPAGFADDVDNDSGGTVTAVATGAGLTGGPITGSGTVAVAPGGIVSGMVANGAIGLAQVDPAQIQARVGGTCPLGSYLRGINPDGSVLCAGLVNPHAVSVVHLNAFGPAGFDLSIALGTDGLPVMSFHEAGNAHALVVLKCGNPACTAANVATYVDQAANDVGAHSSIAISAGGRPVISYHDETAGTLKVVRCGNAACTAGNLITTVDDPANVVGTHTAIAIGADGLPIISYRDETLQALKVLKCGSLACNNLASNVITFVENTASDLAAGTSIAILDGRPVISYWDATAGALKFARCLGQDCSSGVSIVVVDNPPLNTVGRDNSMAIGRDGLPVISYRDETAEALKVAKCGNVNCSAGNVITTVDDPPNGVGRGTSLAIGADGLPIISHEDVTAGALRVTHCGSPDCSTGNVSSLVDDPVSREVGRGSALAIGADGLPVIAAQDMTGLPGVGIVRVVKCGNAACTP